MHSFSVKINSPYDWLVNDLKKLPDDKLIVINVHDMTDRDVFKKALLPYRDRIASIFTGHLHNLIAETGKLRLDGVNIPIIYCGSSEYSRYLQVRFREFRYSSSIRYWMDVSIVSSVYGNSNSYGQQIIRVLNWESPKYGTIKSKKTSLCMDVWEAKIQG